MLRLAFFLIIVISLNACSDSSRRRNAPFTASNPSTSFWFKPSLPVAVEGKLPTGPVPLANQLSTLNNKPSTATVSTAPTTTTVNTANTGVGVNPSHGQPGHRCDIAVGAPLNSAPVATANNASITTQPVTASQPTASTAKATKAATGKNPNHGEPGHRCDIPIGAPLNSPPVTTSTASNTTTTPSTNSQVQTTPANTVSPLITQADPADKNVKLNPAHGQPGHDCTIPVGQPLKK